MRLPDKTVLITGASAGIGEACATRFAETGARLILCARRAARLEALTQQLQTSFDCEVFPLVLDVSDADAVERAITSLPERWRAIDILINNAGLSRAMDPVHRNLIEDIDRMVDTNVKGLLYVTRAVVAGMVERGAGHIINIGSIAGRGVYPGGTVYCATKHAVDAITRGLKIDLHGTPIRVSTVDPGLVETEFSLIRFDGDEDRAGAVYRGMAPLKGDDVADAVLYCATRSPEVNIGQIVLTSVDQSSLTMVHRSEA
jgi:NADP-dependent 3-hydroxy acid dehydrogenase YdfG